MMWFALLASIFLWSPALGQGTVVHSRDDLLRGVHVDRFWDFERTVPELTGGGEISGGVLRVDAPWGGDWVSAAPTWRGDIPFVVEWEARRGAGPPEGEHGLLLRSIDDEEEVLVRFSWEGRVSVEGKSAGRPKPIAGPASTGMIHTGGWDRYAVRVERRRVIVLAGGEEVLVAGLPREAGAGIAFTCGPGASLDVDHVALYRPGRRPPARRNAAPGEIAPFDTAAARSLWKEIETLRGNGEPGPAADRIHDLFLMAPGLPGALDLYFREAVRAGDLDGALAAAEGMRIGGEDGSEEEKIRILALLLARRWDEAHGALARFRAFRPDDPFALENTLLLLDRSGQYERVIREYDGARAGAEPVRAAGHGVASWAYLRTATPERAGEALRSAARQGPGRSDLALAEGDLMRARGDMAGALGRYETVLAAGAVPVPEEDIRLRIALLRFEMGDYERAAREIGALPESGDSEVDRARELVRAAALFQSGRVKDGAGRGDLLEAKGIAEARLGDPPGRRDAVIFDLLGRIEAALAELDLRDGVSYESYRGRRRLALGNFDYAARFDPSYRSTSLAEGEVPDLDPGRFRFLVRIALPDDHPVGGFIENRARWSAWSIVDRRADLAETEIGRILGEGGPR
ncbi:MAG: tetratricopeptide repeat protein [Candidatus Eisenbacteria bacterium]